MADLHIHELSVRRHRVTCADATIIQHSMGHDAITLDLDEEWDGLSVVLAMTGQDGRTYEVIYTGEPIVIPASLTEEPGLLSVCVVGYGGDGTVRVLTAKASRLLRVEQSGPYEGEDPVPDAPDMLQQLTDAYEMAKRAAESAEDAAETVESASIDIGTVTTIGPGEQASASLDGEGLQKTLNLSIPQGAKGDKGDKGDTGDQGVQGDKGEPGTAATIAVGSVTGLPAGASPTVINSGTSTAARFDFGIPKGDKGDKGDPGTGVPDGGTPGQLLSKTDSGTAWVDPPSGNVLTGTATGYVAHAEDAFPQKPREVRVKGKTWVNRWPVLSETHNGITVATDGTGLVTVTGTATADADVTADVSGWAAGKSYTTMVSATPTGCSAYFEVQKPSGNTSINATTTGATLNVASDATNCVAGVHVTSGTAVNASFRVMLVDGTEAPDCFTPCASITSAQPENLVTSGKNLLPPVSEWNTSDRYYNRYIDNPFPIGTQLVGRYGGNPSGLIGSVRLEFRENYDSDDYSAEITPWSATGAVGRAVTVTARDRYICIFTAEPANAYFDQMQVQLELGSTVTSYEPPTITTTPLPEVELRSLPNGTCDELVIKEDGTCEVERRTQLSGDEVTALPEPTIEPQSPVTLPALPAPTFNQYHDADVPSDTSTEYVRDINIVLDNLAKQVAGMASAVAVREASTIEEE